MHTTDTAELARRLLAVDSAAISPTGRTVAEWVEWVEETGFSFWARLADASTVGYDLVDADLDAPTEAELLAILAS